MPDITIEIRPRRQFREFMESDKRWDCLAIHRRGGKTYSSIQKLLKRALTHKRPGPPRRYAYIAPTQAQAKDIAWGYLKRFTAKIPGAIPNESELKITFSDGMTIRLYSGENYERMRGLYFDGVVIDEPEDIDPMAWPSVIRPCLSDYLGWAIWIGTIKGKKGHWKRLTEAMNDPSWFAMILKASESGIIPPEELADIRKTTHPDIYAQEFECDPNIGIPGALFAKFIVDAETGKPCRIFDFEWDRAELVHTFWDLGSPENTRCTYVQFVGREIHIIDHDADLDEVDMTPAKRVAHMRDKGYNFGNHFLPHDAAAKEKSGKNYATQLDEAGLVGIKIIPRCHTIWPGVNKLAELFPRMIFNKTKCKYLIESLENYRRKVDKDGSVTDTIHEDWACHSCFPAGTMVTTRRGDVPIELVVIGDEVWTPVGWDSVTASGATGISDTLRILGVANRSVAATMDHPFFTDRGVIPLGEMTTDDQPWTLDTSLTKWNLKDENTCLRDRITAAQATGKLTPCTAPYGSAVMGRSPRDSRFTTWTTTLSTTIRSIWNSWRRARTSGTTPNTANGSGHQRPSNALWKRPSLRLKLGMPALKDGSGTDSTGFRLSPSGNLWSAFASIAASLTSRRALGPMPAFAAPHASSALPTDTKVSRPNRATSAASHSLAKLKPDTALPSARAEAGTRLSVQPVAAQPVYNLTTARHHCFYANGFLVSNCDSIRMLGEAMLNNMLKGHAEVIRQTREPQQSQPRDLSSFRRYR